MDSDSDIDKLVRAAAEQMAKNTPEENAKMQSIGEGFLEALMDKSKEVMAAKAEAEIAKNTDLLIDGAKKSIQDNIHSQVLMAIFTILAGDKTPEVLIRIINNLKDDFEKDDDEFENMDIPINKDKVKMELAEHFNTLIANARNLRNSFDV